MHHSSNSYLNEYTPVSRANHRNRIVKAIAVSTLLHILLLSIKFHFAEPVQTRQDNAIPQPALRLHLLPPGSATSEMANAGQTSPNNPRAAEKIAEVSLAASLPPPAPIPTVSAKQPIDKHQGSLQKKHNRNSAKPEAKAQPLPQPPLKSLKIIAVEETRNETFSVPLPAEGSSEGANTDIKVETKDIVQQASSGIAELMHKDDVATQPLDATKSDIDKQTALAQARQAEIEEKSRQQAIQEAQRVAEELAQQKAAEQLAARLRQEALEEEARKEAALAAKRLAEAQAEQQRIAAQQVAEAKAAQARQQAAQEAKRLADLRASELAARQARESAAANAAAAGEAARAQGNTRQAQDSNSSGQGSGKSGASVATQGINAKPENKGIAVQSRGLVPDDSCSQKQAGRHFQVNLYATVWRHMVRLKAPYYLLDDAKTRPHVNPIVTVTIRNDGNVENIAFNRSSGRPEIDNAIWRMIHFVAPYAEFPRDLAMECEVIEFPSVWSINNGLNVTWGGQ